MLHISHVTHITCYIYHMLHKSHVTQITCYTYHMLHISRYTNNVTHITCYTNHMLHISHVTHITCYTNHMLHISHVTHITGFPSRSPNSLQIRTIPPHIQSGLPRNCCVYRPWKPKNINLQCSGSFTIYYQHPTMYHSIKAKNFL
jgi:hypothetical protein